MVDLGAIPLEQQTQKDRPLEVSKDKFSRSVLQNLNDAAFQANAQDLKYLVNCGNQIDMRQSITGEAPVHRAVLSTKADKPQALTQIIQCNANLDTLDSNGWTALIHASSIGDMDSVKTLVEAGADLHAYSNQQKQAIHFAAMHNHVHVIRYLKERNAKIEAQDSQGCTPLHLACKKGCYNAVEQFMVFRANIYAKDERDWTPLHYAAYNGHPKICKRLLIQAADDPTDKLRLSLNS